jgi:hypothetical protein
MKRKVFPTLICLLLAFVHPADAPSQIGLKRPHSFSGNKEIRNFDFLNATYDAGCAGQKVKVRNGRYEPHDSAGFYFAFNVSISYGDLTGDGIDEALVLTQCDGAVQNYSEAKVYAVREHKLALKGRTEAGTKNGGNIISAHIRNGRVIVKRGPDEHRCTELPDMAEETTTFKLRGNELKQIGKPVCKLF